MRKPECITFTGADDYTSIKEIQSLHDDYPVEFGVLFSKTKQGTARYPSFKWITRAARCCMNLSAHLCGEYAKTLLATGSLDFNFAGFDRAQINTTSSLSKKTLSNIGNWARGFDMVPIFQCSKEFPLSNDALWVFDQSGGGGVLPRKWPKSPSEKGGQAMWLTRRFFLFFGWHTQASGQMIRIKSMTDEHLRNAYNYGVDHFLGYMMTYWTAALPKFQNELVARREDVDTKVSSSNN